MMATSRKRGKASKKKAARKAKARSSSSKPKAKKQTPSKAAKDTGFSDLEKLGSMFELMSSHDVSEIEIAEGETSLKIKRGYQSLQAPMPQLMAAPAPMSHVAPAPVAPAPAAAPADKAAAAPQAPADDPSLETLKSPMVGTFYGAPSPESAPYVKEGDRVGPDSTVCIIEAMKVMNEIKAEHSGEVVEVLVENGEAVEFGQPLFVLRRAG